MKIKTKCKDCKMKDLEIKQLKKLINDLVKERA